MKGHPEGIMKDASEEQLRGRCFILNLNVFICTCYWAIPKAPFSACLSVQPKQKFIDPIDPLMFSSPKILKCQKDIIAY